MQHVKVTYIGLNNLFSRVTTLLLKQSPVVKRLTFCGEQKFHENEEIKDFTSDYQITTFNAKEQIFEALKGADIVLIGDKLIKRNNGLDDEIAAQKLYDYAKAFVVVATTPINVFLPFFGQLECLNAGKLIGASTLDTVRANDLLAKQLRLDPRSVVLPVVGGCSPLTRVPLFSHAYPATSVSNMSAVSTFVEKKTEIIKKIRNNEKNDEDTAIEKAYATVRLIHSIAAALIGPSQIPEIGLVKNFTPLNVEYFSLPLLIGKNGIEKVFTLKNITKQERKMVEKAIENMNVDLDKAKVLLGMHDLENKNDECIDDKLDYKQEYIFLGNVNYKSENHQQQWKKSPEKELKSGKLKGMLPLHCPAEPYLETPSASLKKDFARRKSLGWRLVPPMGVKKKNIGDFNDDSDFANHPGVDNFLRRDTEQMNNFEEIEPALASQNSIVGKTKQNKQLDCVQTDFTLDNEADIEIINYDPRKSMEYFKTYNKVQQKTAKKSTEGKDIDEKHDLKQTKLENKFTVLDEGNISEEIVEENVYKGQRKTVSEQEITQSTTKDAFDSLEIPSLGTEYRILVVDSNVNKAEGSFPREGPKEYNTFHKIQEEDKRVPLKEQTELLDNGPSSLAIKINGNKNTMISTKQSDHEKVAFTQSNLPLKDTSITNTSRRSEEAGHSNTSNLPASRKDSLLALQECTLTLPQKDIPKIAKYVTNVESDFDAENTNDTAIAQETKNDKPTLSTTLRQPVCNTIEPSPNRAKIRESISTHDCPDKIKSKFYDTRNLKMHSYSIYEQPINRIRKPSDVSSANENLNENQAMKHGEGNSISTLNNMAKQNYNLHKENDFYMLKSPSKRDVEAENYKNIRRASIKELDGFQLHTIAQTSNFQPNAHNSKLPRQNYVQATDSQKSKSLSQNRKQSNNFQKFKPLPQNKLQIIDREKSQLTFSKSKTLSQTNPQSADKQKSKQISSLSKSPTRINTQLTDSKKSKPILLKSKQNSDAQKCKPEIKSLAESKEQSTDSQKSNLLFQSHVQPSDTQTDTSESQATNTLSKSVPLSTDSQKLKPKLISENSAQSIHSEKSKSILQSSEQQINAQHVDVDKISQTPAQSSDLQISKPLSDDSRQYPNVQKSSPPHQNFKQLSQSTVQRTDAKKSTSDFQKVKSFTERKTQSLDTLKTKTVLQNLKSPQKNAKLTDSQNTKLVYQNIATSKAEDSQTNIKPTSFKQRKSANALNNFQNSNPLFKKTVSQTEIQPSDSPKPNREIIENNLPANDFNSSKLPSANQVHVNHTHKYRPGQNNLQCHDAKANPPNNNLKIIDSQRDFRQSKPNTQYLNLIAADKFVASLRKKNIREINEGQKSNSEKMESNESIKTACCFNELYKGISNLNGSQTSLEHSKKSDVEVHLADKSEKKILAKKINDNGKPEKIAPDEEKSSESEKRIFKSTNTESANNAAETCIVASKFDPATVKSMPSAVHSNSTDCADKTETSSRKNEKLQETKHGYKIARTNKEVKINSARTNINTWTHLKDKEIKPTNLQLSHKIKLEEKKLLLTKGKMNKDRQQTKLTGILQSESKFKPTAERTDSVVVRKPTKEGTRKLTDKQTYVEQSAKAADQLFKAVNFDHVKVIGNKQSQKSVMLNEVTMDMKNYVAINKKVNLQKTEGRSNQARMVENQKQKIGGHIEKEIRAKTEFPRRKLTIKPIVATKPQTSNKKVTISSSALKTPLTGSGGKIKDYGMKLIDKHFNDTRMKKTKFLINNKLANQTALTEYDKWNVDLTNNTPTYSIKRSFNKSIMEDNKNRKNIQMNKPATRQKYAKTVAKEKSPKSSLKKDSKCIQNENNLNKSDANNAEKKYKVWIPPDEVNLNNKGGERDDNESKKTGGWGGRLLQLFKNVIIRDVEDQKTRNQITTESMKLKNKLPPLNDVRTKVFVGGNQLSPNWKSNMNNDRSLYKNFNDRIVEKLSLSNNSSMADSKKGFQNVNDVDKKSFSQHKILTTKTNHTIKDKKEVMAYFGKKISYKHNLDAGSLDNLSSKMMNCRPYRKPVRLMSRFKPYYDFSNNDNC
uniref:Ldh_1_C domain-containing protein n=1 Tax=Rhodnius prolixus TaxID=13249 RepID=T1HNX4_RHOPR